MGSKRSNEELVIQWTDLAMTFMSTFEQGFVGRERILNRFSSRTEFYFPIFYSFSRLTRKIKRGELAIHEETCTFGLKTNRKIEINAPWSRLRLTVGTGELEV